MPVAVSDAGPIIHLAQIGKLQLLEKLFGCVQVTARVKVEVFDEGVKLGCADAEAIGKALENGWLAVEVFPEGLAKPAGKLAEGENISRADAETLLLAKAKKAELLVDDKVVSDLAKMYGLKVWSTWTLLLESVDKGLTTVADVENAVSDLGKKKFQLKEKHAREIVYAAKIIEERKMKVQSKKKKWGKNAFLDSGDATFGDEE